MLRVLHAGSIHFGEDASGPCPLQNRNVRRLVRGNVRGFTGVASPPELTSNTAKFRPFASSGYFRPDQSDNDTQPQGEINA